MGEQRVVVEVVVGRVDVPVDEAPPGRQHPLPRFATALAAAARLVWTEELQRGAAVRQVEQRGGHVRKVEVLQESAFAQRAGGLERELKDAFVVARSRQEDEHVRDLRLTNRREAARVVAVGAVADHVRLRIELVDVARRPGPLGVLERKDVARRGDPGDHAVVDQALELRQLVAVGCLVEAPGAGWPARDLQRREPEDEAFAGAAHVALDAPLDPGTA